MTAIAATPATSSPSREFQPIAREAWGRGDPARAVVWLLVAIAVRAPLVARIEGVLDHDQAIVGLMALDIAAGRRLPIFFDGQRYMGAVEAYLAAGFVALFGHSPRVVALSPLVFLGLFAAGQYALWRRWGDRVTGHLAALVTVLGAPMLALWSVVPRGGYIELLAWALPVLGTYRAVTRPGSLPLSPTRQAGWGSLLIFGYFLNPLSLIVYLTMAIDWTFGRHGADLRRDRGLEARWLDAPLAPVVWFAAAVAVVAALAVCCHVEFPHQGQGLSPFVFMLNALPNPWNVVLGGLGLLAIAGGAAVWSGAAWRTVRRLLANSWFMLGAMLPLVPFAAHHVIVRLGLVPYAHSLPIWIRGPWDVGVNLRDGAGALGPLAGCSPRGPESVLIGQGVELPATVWPGLARWLEITSPVVVGLVALLIASVYWRDRPSWRRFWSLRGEEPTPPTVLVLTGLGVTAALYVLQATSPNSSSIRYLVPVWIFLPGLLASALRSLAWPRRALIAGLLLVPWTLAQVNLWAEIDRPSPLRPLARALERRGVQGIVAETPVALMVADLTSGRVGALEYRSKWPRLGNRYGGRFAAGRPVTCVVDTQLKWFPGEDPSGSLLLNMGPTLRLLAREHPGRVRHVSQVDQFEVWEVDLPLAEILPAEDADLLPARKDSGKVATTVAPTPDKPGGGPHDR